jgi:uncharacterized protein with GYD domain
MVSIDALGAYAVKAEFYSILGANLLRRFQMAKYMIQISINPQAYVSMLQNPQDRAVVVRPMFEALGGKLEQYYIELGGSTAYMIVEMPEPNNIATLCAVVQAGGAATSLKVTTIIPSDETVGILENATKIAYQPPST